MGEMVKFRKRIRSTRTTMLRFKSAVHSNSSCRTKLDPALILKVPNKM